MSIQAKFEKKVFEFKRPAGTSRGILNDKKAWFISVWDDSNPSIVGVGECSIIPNLSSDYIDDFFYEMKIKEVVDNVQYFIDNPIELETFPSIYFGLEMALLDLENGGKSLFFDTDFSKGKMGIPINGLIWMGAPDFMFEQIQQKLEEGYSCIKMKIGAIDFNEEIKLLEGIRSQFSSDKITLRVDANGAFTPADAPEKLKKLAELSIHSIEQPIKSGQVREMAKLCEMNILPIALDEELIGIYDPLVKGRLLDDIKPQYIILKPSLIGGFKGAKEWIELAEKRNIPWWITSALESNVGLNAIAQFTSTFQIEREQGLGTGMLYVNNVPSPMFIEKGYLKIQKDAF
ncbi:MAG: o-succinylbenzoate synthase [Brumimicrobium sp.]|nr:o-succinylbenzoate synthase [Brumimicrobium sp.]